MKAAIKTLIVCLIVLLLPGPADARIDGPKKRSRPAKVAPGKAGGGPAASANRETQTDANRPAKVDFMPGYRLYSKKKYLPAARCLFGIMQSHSADDTDYEWAEFFFGLSLKKLGLTHAAVDMLSELVTRKPNQKIVTYCLELFEQSLTTHPVERDLIINRVLCDQEYGFVDGLVADFVNYHQGVYDWQHGFYDWGRAHFEKISPQSPYYYQYLYQKVLLHVYRDQIDEAVAILESILQSDRPYPHLKNDARKTLARLLYEQQQFKKADRVYGQIDLNILQQAENLLERAWAHYRLGNPEKAMGLLYSFEAPSYRDAFKPEYFILKSFIYKDVCHYERALEVIEEFRKRYGDALQIIYTRGDTADNHALMRYLLNKNRIRRTWDFLQLLEKERALCAGLKDKALQAYLENLYDLQIEQSRRKLKRQIENDYEIAANDLLRYEENAHLMEYEIGLDMYKRVYDTHYREDAVKDRQDSLKARVVYPFQGEFWNDELATYRVELPDKCQDMEQWDIFFE